MIKNQDWVYQVIILYHCITTKFSHQAHLLWQRSLRCLQALCRHAASTDAVLGHQHSAVHSGAQHLLFAFLAMTTRWLGNSK